MTTRIYGWLTEAQWRGSLSRWSVIGKRHIMGRNAACPWQWVAFKRYMLSKLAPEDNLHYFCCSKSGATTGTDPIASLAEALRWMADQHPDILHFRQPLLHPKYS